MDTLKNLHRIYVDECENDDEKISLTKFMSLRPKECVFPNDSSAHNSCLCIYHENINLAVESLIHLKIFENITKNNLLKEMKSLLMCTEPTDECYLRSCENCENNSIQTFLTEAVDKTNLVKIKRSCWIVSKRTDLMDIEEDVDVFIEKFEEDLEKFITHEFKLKKQQTFIESKKQCLKSGEIVVQIDFSENYSCFTQNAVQSDFFTAVQVTIHPCAIYYVENNSTKLFKIVIISDVVKHTTASVYAFQKRIIPVLKEKFEDLRKIIYVSDGAGSQYKNIKNFKNVCMHKHDFDLEAEWHFTVTSHGKSACDGIGGALKRTARNDTLRGSKIKNAQNFFDWAKNRFADTVLLYVDGTEIMRATQEIEEKGEYRSLPGTLKYHQFVPKTEDELEIALYSGSSEKEIRKIVKKTQKVIT